jgi:galactokinase
MERAQERFAAHFGHTPEFVGAAPGRVNLIGEHTDYNGGLVLPMTIATHCVAVGSPARGPTSRLLAVDLNETFEFTTSGDLSRLLDESPPKGTSHGSWASYVLGVLDGLAKSGVPVPSMDVAIASNIPIGAGLSSSAALEVSIGVLVQSVVREAFDPMDLARLCRKAEHEFAGVPCGIMDQLAVAMAKPGMALLIDCATENVTPVPLPPKEKASIVVVDTAVRHRLADGAYGRLCATCDAAARKLGVSMLSAARIEELDGAALSPEEKRCARHVLTENQRVRKAVEALRQADLSTLGGLMYESHASLRNEYCVSCPELDTVVDAARTAPGVFGARMTGGGFGGCAIVLAEPARASAVCQTIATQFESAHGHTCRVMDAATGHWTSNHGPESVIR